MVVKHDFKMQRLNNHNTVILTGKNGLCSGANKSIDVFFKQKSFSLKKNTLIFTNLMLETEFKYCLNTFFFILQLFQGCKS